MPSAACPARAAPGFNPPPVPWTGGMRTTSGATRPAHQVSIRPRSRGPGESGSICATAPACWFQSAPGPVDRGNSGRQAMEGRGSIVSIRPRSRGPGEFAHAVPTLWAVKFQSAPGPVDRGNFRSSRSPCRPRRFNPPPVPWTGGMPAGPLQFLVGICFNPPPVPWTGGIWHAEAFAVQVLVSIRPRSRGPGEYRLAPALVVSALFQSAPGPVDRGNRPPTPPIEPAIRFNPPPVPWTGGIQARAGVGRVGAVSIRPRSRGPGE